VLQEFVKMMRRHDEHPDGSNGPRKLQDNSRYQIALVLFVIAIGLAYLAWAHYAPL